MPVFCSKCGEELLGAVNRCWRCGRPFTPQRGPRDVPPVIQVPPASRPAPQPLAAQIVSDVDSIVAPSIRRGSPFADPTPPVPGRSPGPAAGALPLATKYPRHPAAAVGTPLSLLAGSVALLLAFVFPAGAIISALTGVAMGCWGLHSPRRGAAIAGLALACIALAVSAFLLAADLYSLLHGVRPWETTEPI